MKVQLASFNFEYIKLNFEVGSFNFETTKFNVQTGKFSNLKVKIGFPADRQSLVFQATIYKYLKNFFELLMQSKDVFILGAGFSYAATDGQIPAMSGLMEKIKDSFKEKHPEDFPKVDNYNDLEFMLSDLYLKQPYGDDSGYHQNLSLYYKVLKVLVYELNCCESKFHSDLQSSCIDLLSGNSSDHVVNCIWFNKLIGHLMNSNFKHSLITFNYDNLFEIESSFQIVKVQRTIYRDQYITSSLIKLKNTLFSRLYPQSLPSSSFRHGLINAQFIDYQHAIQSLQPKFAIYKLHGSLNLRWDRDTNSSVYLEDASSDYLEPFIIPPVLDKTNELAHPYLKLNWRLAAEALKEAERVFIIGYSVPLTDFSTRAMLFNSQFDKQNRKKKKFKVYPVNIEYPKSLSAIFSNDLIAKQYCYEHQDSNGKTAIEKFVEDLVNDQV